MIQTKMAVHEVSDAPEVPIKVHLNQRICVNDGSLIFVQQCEQDRSL